jgi:N-acetylglutamate synthase-like GNAT family acetyltransferase
MDVLRCCHYSMTHQERTKPCWIQNDDDHGKLLLMVSTVKIRKARKDDSQAIRRLVWGAGLNPTALKWQRFVVAVNPVGEVVGCAQVKPHRDGSHELASLVVSPAYRLLGIARLLVEDLIQCHDGDLYLMCRAALGGFYRKFGFDVPANEELPPYFSRIARLASHFNRRQKAENGLLIMKRPSPPS